MSERSGHRWDPTTDTHSIQIAPLVFDVCVDGCEDLPLVSMLHGFGVSRFFWDAHLLRINGIWPVAIVRT